METLERKLEILSKTISKPLDFILHCGDICHHGRNSDYQEVKGYFHKFFPEIPFLVTVGNHDDPQAMDTVFSTEQEPITGFVRQFPDLQVISLNNSKGEHGAITEAQAQWCAQQLDRDKDSILFTHHHFFQEQSPMPSVEIAPQFYEAINNPKLKGIFTGHTHYFYETKLQAVPYFAVDSFSFQGKDSGKGYLHMRESCGYNLFAYHNKKISLAQQGMLGVQKELPLYHFH